MGDYIKREDAIKALAVWKISPIVLDPVPAADVRENVKANLAIAGYKKDGSTQWFECSVCGGSVDFTDNFCKHCGAYFKGGTT